MTKAVRGAAHPKSTRAKWGASRLALTVALGVIAPATAWAQTSDTVGEVVVTASRLVSNGFSAPTPTTVFGTADLQRSAPVQLADAVNTLPQMFASQVPQGAWNVTGLNQGGNYLNLRGLGANRTLVLLNGQRVVPSTSVGTTDVNLFPTALVSRVDIVTGGASAAWGSDAVTGVVNFVLDTNFNGVKGSLEGGESDYGDGGNFRASLTAGRSFAGGRGHVEASAAYSKVNEIFGIDTRDWYTSPRLLQNPAWTANGNQPYFITVHGLGVANSHPDGLITTVAGGAPASLVGTTFPGGQPVRNFTFGTLYSAGQIQTGGTRIDGTADQPIRPSEKAYQGFIHAKYDITEKLTASIQGAYATSETFTRGIDGGQAGTGANGAITIRTDNPFLPASILAQMPAGSSFTLGRQGLEPGLTMLSRNRRHTNRWSAALDYDFGNGWTASAYAQYGRTFIDGKVFQNIIVNNLALASDAVLVTAANRGASGLAIGSAACRSTLTAPTNGCVPFNPFGLGAPSAAALAYVTGTSQSKQVLKQTVYSFQVNGEPFSTWAGPVPVAFGVERREERIDAQADPIAIANGFRLGNFKPIAGAIDVTEGFAEANIPLLKDKALFQSLDLNAAGRYTHYNTSGNVQTWKLGLNWVVNDELRFRGTRSHDIRAPNMNELYAAQTQGRLTVFDPVLNVQQSVLQITSGNTNLKPEVSNQWAVGAVYRPSWIKGFQASVDYYDTKINSAIATITPTNVVAFCSQGQAIYCPLIIRDPPTGGAAVGIINSVLAQPINANSETLRGLDFEFSYRPDLASFGMPGQLALRTLVTRTLERTIRANNVTQNLLGQTAVINQAAPQKWRGLFTVDYNWGPSRTSVQVTYLGKGVIDNTYVEGGNQALLSVDNNTINSFTTVDLTQNFDLSSLLNRKIELFFTVKNLFNTAPPLAVYAGNNATYWPGTNPGIYDMIGRQYRAGLRFQF